MKRIVFQLIMTEFEKQQLKRIAHKNEVTASEMIRILIEREIKNEQNN